MFKVIYERTIAGVTDSRVFKNQEEYDKWKSFMDELGEEYTILTDTIFKRGA